MKIKILSNIEDKRQGLKGKLNIPKDEIYLFLDSNHCTMKDMNFSLKLLWLNENFEIIKQELATPNKEYKNKKATHFAETHGDNKFKNMEKIKNNHFTFKHKKKQGSSIRSNKTMVLLDDKGEPQMYMEGGELVFSKISTKAIINQAEKVSNTKMNEDELYKLGNIVLKERQAQKTRD